MERVAFRFLHYLEVSYNERSYGYPQIIQVNGPDWTILISIEWCLGEFPMFRKPPFDARPQHLNLKIQMK